MQGSDSCRKFERMTHGRFLKARLETLWFVLFLFVSGCDRNDAPQIVIEEHPDLDSIGDAWKDGQSPLHGKSYPEVVRSISGGMVLPFNLEEPLDSEIWTAIVAVVKAAAEQGIAKEMELADWMRDELDQTPELLCDPELLNPFVFGSPAIRFVHAESGRIVFLVVSLESTRELPLRLSPEEAFAAREKPAHHLSVHFRSDGWIVTDLTAISLDFLPVFRTAVPPQEERGVIGEQKNR